jgi:hypothetical protein
MDKGSIVTQSAYFGGSPSSAFLHSCQVDGSVHSHQSEVKPCKTLFIGAIKDTGEPLARISAQTLVEKMALASLLRVVLSQLEAQFAAAIPLATVQDQASNIRRAA